jgi:ectoine hydroxylase-related dioxygenase (phytanoyl-CoA dioxygenase family)
MNKLINHKSQFSEKGYAIIPDVFSLTEIEQLKDVINKSDSANETFRKSNDLFAIRQFLKEIPEAGKIVLNKKLCKLIDMLFGSGYFITKSIYFDKPAASNWYVAYHQDLTISVDKKIDKEGFGSWTIKHNQFGVQPPLEFLEQNFTIRIHLDDTDENNGALKIIPASHSKGVWRNDVLSISEQHEESCNVPAGGIMIMHPLLMHASGRTTNNKQRRVIHIEFSNKELPEELNWSEKQFLN